MSLQPAVLDVDAGCKSSKPKRAGTTNLGELVQEIEKFGHYAIYRLHRQCRVILLRRKVADRSKRSKVALRFLLSMMDDLIIHRSMYCVESLGNVNARRAPDTPNASDADSAPNELTLRLAAHLEAARSERGWSQRRLAAEIGLSSGYIVRVLRGEANVGLGMLLVIATRLGKDPRSLIDPI